MLKGLLRVHLLALEHKLGGEIPSNHPIIAWLVTYVSDVASKYLAGADGRTAFEKCRGKAAGRPIVEIGERVLAQELLADPSARGNMEERFVEGVVIGIVEESDELVVSTARGLILARNVKRREPGSQWRAA